MTKIKGQGHGGVLRHLHLSHRGASALSSQAPHQSNPWCVTTQWKQNLCANLEKCTFGMTQVQYLGYIIDERGVHVDPTKIQVIWDWSAPTTLT